MAANAVKDVNPQLENNDTNCVRKAVIRCRLSFCADRLWSEAQLIQEFKESIAKHRFYFDGQPAHPSDIQNQKEVFWSLIDMSYPFHFVTGLICETLSNNVSPQIMLFTLFLERWSQNSGSKITSLILNPVTGLDISAIVEPLFFFNV